MQRYNLSTFEVLCVDGCAHFRKLVAAMLRRFGVNVILEADDGQQGLNILKQHSVDIVLTEWLMEPMSGYEMVKRIRRGGEVQNPMVPVIMLTGHTEEKRVLAARDAGISEFLAKPVSPERLFHRITLVIDKPRTFVKAPNYVGPDRRRFVNYDYDGPERRDTKNADRYAADAQPKEDSKAESPATAGASS